MVRYCCKDDSFMAREALKDARSGLVILKHGVAFEIDGG
jgi:hypothetical protein